MARCSTPLGVTDFGTRRSPSGHRSCSRAQRLSASLTSALKALDALLRGLGVCSTPLGVTDFGTLWRTTLPGWIRLCSTPLGVTDFGTPHRAGAAGAAPPGPHPSRRHSFPPQDNPPTPPRLAPSCPPPPSSPTFAPTL